MSLTVDQIKILFALAMSYDNRKPPGDANLQAWHEAAARGRWTFDAAVEAIHQHGTHSTDFLTPAHITQRVRADQRHPAPFVNPTRTALPPGVADTTRAIPAAESKPFVSWPGRKARRRRLDDATRAMIRAELDARRPAPDPDPEPEP